MGKELQWEGWRLVFCCVTSIRDWMKVEWKLNESKWILISETENVLLIKHSSHLERQLELSWFRTDAGLQKNRKEVGVLIKGLLFSVVAQEDFNQMWWLSQTWTNLPRLDHLRLDFMSSFCTSLITGLSFLFSRHYLNREQNRLTNFALTYYSGYDHLFLAKSLFH